MTAGPSETNGLYNADKTRICRVRYPWHPLFGQEIVVIREMVFCGSRVFCCHEIGKEDRKQFRIQAWMCDLAVCSEMKLVENPAVSVEVLFALARLISDMSGSQVCSMVSEGHHPEDGDAHEMHGQEEVEAGSAEPVCSTTSAPRVAGAARRCPEGGGATPGGDPAGSRGRPCRSRGGRR